MLSHQQIHCGIKQNLASSKFLFTKESERTNLVPMNPQAPRLYGLPKVHKEEYDSERRSISFSVQRSSNTSSHQIVLDAEPKGRSLLMLLETGTARTDSVRPPRPRNGPAPCALPDATLKVVVDDLIVTLGRRPPYGAPPLRNSPLLRLLFIQQIRRVSWLFEFT
ncbi:hypothetical protein EVAR_48110_1 [Eumeta japonica]|uniref:Uncharacterized protein n=1 Tax=Eumeta variegata TaxID=151549 RepID=A0A4C1XJA2_EUMVA|nr:hypothetical protein EVAR_48110_1 [Eumeta japonica]